MKLINKIRLKLGIVKELFRFLWKQKLWWLIPLLSVLILLSLFFIFAQATTIAPFIYPLI
jgi:hypothetical protein